MTPLAKKVFELFGKPEGAAELESKPTEEQAVSPPTPGPCPQCGKPAVIEAVEPSRDGTSTLTYWRCGPCQTWTVTPATPATQTVEPHDSRTPPPGEVNYRALYQETAEATCGDCFLIDPSWLLDHPEFHGRIRALDERLTVMEGNGAGELEYRTTLARLVQCVREAQALQAREQAGAGQRARQ